MNVPLEIDEQAAVVEYLDILVAQGKVVVFSAVPNNTWTRSWKQKNKQKREGVRPGVPDLIVVTKNRVIFIEMKRKKIGSVKVEQDAWINAIQKTGTFARVCYGFEDAKKFIDESLLDQGIPDCSTCVFRNGVDSHCHQPNCEGFEPVDPSCHSYPHPDRFSR